VLQALLPLLTVLVVYVVVVRLGLRHWVSTGIIAMAVVFAVAMILHIRFGVGATAELSTAVAVALFAGLVAGTIVAYLSYANAAPIAHVPITHNHGGPSGTGTRTAAAATGVPTGH
jgi:hypothetical protein